MKRDLKHHHLFPISPRSSSRRTTPSPSSNGTGAPDEQDFVPDDLRCRLPGNRHRTASICSVLDRPLLRAKSSTCKHISHSSPCRPRTHPTAGRRKRRKHPAEKPRGHQWCHAEFRSGVFVCGRCKKFFERREETRRHRRIC